MVDYSKWKDIEISDDEDETHPNIDTPSLFRWRHQARVERMEQAQKEKEEILTKKQATEARLKEIKELLQKGEGDIKALEKEQETLENESKEIAKKEDDLVRKEKKTPWNVDTISKPGFEKTVINTAPKKRNDDDMSDEEKSKRTKEFIKENEELLKKYGLLRRYEDSKNLLMSYSHLVCEDTANYLVIWCINLEMEKKHDLMAHVAHQCICMQYILELAKQLDVDPRACVGAVLLKIQNATEDYKKQFIDEIEQFKKRIQKRAEEKIQEAIAEAEEEERQARLGPGGLDPVEVFETLPDELKSCFESRDIKLLQETIAKMPEEQARFHMKRCVDSGLWIPDAGLRSTAEGEGEENESQPTDGENTEEQHKGEFSFTQKSIHDVD